MCTVSLELPGDFAYNSTGMTPEDGSIQNIRRQAIMQAGSVTVVIS